MNKKEKIKELETVIDEHDCRLSPEDGCDCLSLRRELFKLKVEK